MQAFIGLWALVFFTVLLNGFAAGVAAAFHVWRPRQPRRSRILTAAAVAGLIPAMIAVPTLLMDVSMGARAPFGLVLGVAVISVVAMVASLPGAVIIGRKLDGPGNAYTAFE